MISIESPSDKLKSGDSGYAEIQTGLKRDIVTLPYSAVMQDEKANISTLSRTAEQQGVTL